MASADEATVVQIYPVEIPDGSYYRNLISCQNACPVHTDARGYVNAIAERDYRAGYIIARQPNPFASTCGRVCNAPCEAACRRGNIDGAVTIRALKRFVCEHYGVESKKHLSVSKTLSEGLMMPTLDNSNTVESLANLLLTSERKVGDGRRARVAVIGAGPAGLTAAHDLAALGYNVTVLEASSAPGGMLFLGIPEYRLPRDVIRQEIDDILRQGIELKLDMRLGRDFNLRNLRDKGYEAIFIAIGAYVDRDPGMEGTNLKGVIYSLDFLREVNLSYRASIGNRVLVVGGGGTAVDAARTLLRIGDGFIEKDGVAAMDAARGALRLGAREVHILYRGARAEMRAPEEEIKDALEEGVVLYTNRAPTKILGTGGKVTGIETIQVQSTVDDAGSLVRSIIPGSEEVFHGDTVIMAVGQGSDLSFIRKEDGIQVTRERTIAVDPETLATTAPGIFAGGDVAFGPRIIIEAVRDGHKAARAIKHYLEGSKSSIHHHTTFKVITKQELPAEGWSNIPKRRPSLLPLERRTGVSEVEMVYQEDMAVKQAVRCLRCDIQTIFNGDLCILCGGCVDVCPWNCLKMVRLDKITGDERIKGAVKARYGISFEEFHKGGKVLNNGTAMIKDETRCTRCGLCAERCPTSAITMEAFGFSEEVIVDEIPV